MSAQRILLSLAAVAACNGTDVSDFHYGAGQPGVGMAEGGEIRHENVRILGKNETWIMVYQYKGPAVADTAPFADPTVDAQNPGGKWGNCVDERSGSPTWPFHAITGATYLTLPQVKLTGPGITGTLDVTKNTPPNKVGNSTFRSYDFTYGGGALDATASTSGFNATLTVAEATPDADYTLDIGQGPLTYHMPAAFTAPLGIGGAATVMIPKGKDLEYSWTTPANDKGTNGSTHTAKTYFNFTLFADPTAANPPQFICFPDVDGHQVVPKAVIDAIPDAGLIVNANLSHYLASQMAMGEARRFDLVSIYCNISAYAKQ
jgi:hypothetical protein